MTTTIYPSVIIGELESAGDEGLLLGELVERFEAIVSVPKSWDYHIVVRPDSRLHWRASLAVRNALRALVRNGTVIKTRPGHYRIGRR